VVEVLLAIVLDLAALEVLLDIVRDTVVEEELLAIVQDTVVVEELLAIVQDTVAVEALHPKVAVEALHPKVAVGLDTHLGGDTAEVAYAVLQAIDPGMVAVEGRHPMAVAGELQAIATDMVAAGEPQDIDLDIHLVLVPAVAEVDNYQALDMVQAGWDTPLYMVVGIVHQVVLRTDRRIALLDMHLGQMELGQEQMARLVEQQV
jgi:hypothetical protein